MTFEFVTDEKNRDVWNRLALHPLQSWEWGDARIEMGIDVVRVGLYEKDALKKVYQLTFHKIPYTPFTIGYLPRSDIPDENLLTKLWEVARDRKCIYIKIEPYVKHSTETENQIKKLSSQFSLIKSPSSLFPDWTQKLDLTKSEEDLLKNCKPKTRYNIKLAQKKGVTVTVDEEKSFDVFAKLYFETCRRQKYHGHNLTYHKTIFKNLGSSMAHVFVANFEGKPLCAYEVFLFNDILYYPYGGSSTQNKSVMAPNLLMWETILWGKRQGAKVFDMWGSLPPEEANRVSSWAGFTRFKQGYGTDYVRFIGSYDFIINGLLFRPLDYVIKLRKKLM